MLATTVVKTSVSECPVCSDNRRGTFSNPCIRRKVTRSCLCRRDRRGPWQRSGLLLLCLLCGCGTNQIKSNEIKNEIKVVVDGGTAIDLGDRIAGKAVEHIVLVRNEGPANIRLGQPTTSCGCSSVDVAKPNLPPGAATDVVVNLNVTTKHDAQQVIQIDIPINEPPNAGSIHLVVLVRAIVPLSADPSSLRLSGAAEERQSARIRVSKHVPVGVKEISVVPEGPVVVSVNGKTEADEFTLSAIASMPPQTDRWNGRVVIRTDHLEFPILEIPIELETRLPLRANPPSVVFMPRSSTNAEKTVVVRALDGFHLASYSFTKAVAGVEAQWKELSEQAATIRLVLDTSSISEQRITAGTLEIVAKHPNGSEERLDIPVFVVNADGRIGGGSVQGPTLDAPSSKVSND